MTQLPTVTIDRLAFGGEGVARLDDGKIVFVPDALPGDQVQIALTEEHATFARAKMTQLLTPSPGRTAARCADAAACGSCQFQHAEQADEWRWKAQAALDAIARLSRLTLPEDVHEHGPAEPDGWRRRVRFQVDSRGSLGYYAAGSHRLVRPRRCLVAHPSLLSARLLLEPAMKNLGAEAVQLEVGDDGSVVGCVELAAGRTAAAAQRLRPIIHKARKDGATLVGLRLTEQLQAAEPKFTDIGHVQLPVRVLDQLYTLPAGLFTQANPAVNDALVTYVIQELGLSPEDNLLELYCGWGNFSHAILKTTPCNFQGMELAIPAIQTAEDILYPKRRRKEPIPDDAPVRFNVRNLTRGLPNKHVSPGRYSHVLLDPPRAGARPVIEHLLTIAPKRVVYVSCDASTLARDLQLLTSQHLRLTRLGLFDMFPRTHHVEVVATLEASA